MIAGRFDEDLSLMLEAAEGFTMQDAIAVALITGAYKIRLFGLGSARAFFCLGGKLREVPLLIPFGDFSNRVGDQC
jgi:hypothetical protein